MKTKARVYMETSFISYLATALQERFSGDINVAHRQLTSRLWWQRNREHFDLFISDMVYIECNNGHADAILSRMAVLSCAKTLEDSLRIIELAKHLVEPAGPLPRKAEADATHIAFASVYGCEYLLTWNFKHIANAILQRSLYKVIQDYGYQPSIICTPEELMGNRDER